MSAVDYSDFLIRYPQFSDPTKYPQSNVEAILGESEIDTPYSTWGTLQVRGIKLLTAHRLSMVARSEGGTVQGGVTSLSVSKGSHSVSFAQPSGGESDVESLSLTLYGQEYLALKSRLLVCGFVI